MSDKEMFMVFIIQAHMGETPQMQLQNVAILQLIDTSVENALKRAEKIMPEKKHFRIKEIIENFVPLK